MGRARPAIPRAARAWWGVAAGRAGRKRAEAGGAAAHEDWGSISLPELVAAEEYLGGATWAVAADCGPPAVRIRGGEAAGRARGGVQGRTIAGDDGVAPRRHDEKLGECHGPRAWVASVGGAAGSAANWGRRAGRFRQPACRLGKISAAIRGPPVWRTPRSRSFRRARELHISLRSRGVTFPTRQ